MRQKDRCIKLNKIVTTLLMIKLRIKELSKSMSGIEFHHLNQSLNFMNRKTLLRVNKKVAGLVLL